ncbi:hypothetical protein NPIL_457721 [Nephila pilipes]|uniref:Uncharacterized protein n=1 Tax=Nephila pilipes TaxID=299642 RepID=A0A8X6PIL9_NEPPI|nr:hypothetical protein NPIL_457721 [Nephila pilipes]
MACICKLEEDARKLWNEMDPNIKKYHFRNFVRDSKKVWMNIVGEWAKCFESRVIIRFRTHYRDTLEMVQLCKVAFSITCHPKNDLKYLEN